jgi:outer membrane biosynthesis protein TonB
MRKLLLLATFALAASLIFATAALAQEDEMYYSEEVETPSGEATVEAEGPPEEVGPAVQQVEQEAVQPQMEEPQMEQPKMEEPKAEMKMEEPKAEMKMDKTVSVEQSGYAPLPKSGGPAVGSVLLPVAALLLGSGILAYAILRRR